MATKLDQNGNLWAQKPDGTWYLVSPANAPAAAGNTQPGAPPPVATQPGVPGPNALDQGAQQGGKAIGGFLKNVLSPNGQMQAPSINSDIDGVMNTDGTPIGSLTPADYSAATGGRSEPQTDLDDLDESDIAALMSKGGEVPPQATKPPSYETGGEVDGDTPDKAIKKAIVPLDQRVQAGVDATPTQTLGDTGKSVLNDAATNAPPILKNISAWGNNLMNGGPDVTPGQILGVGVPGSVDPTTGKPVQNDAEFQQSLADAKSRDQAISDLSAPATPPLDLQKISLGSQAYTAPTTIPPTGQSVTQIPGAGGNPPLFPSPAAKEAQQQLENAGYATEQSALGVGSIQAANAAKESAFQSDLADKLEANQQASDDANQKWEAMYGPAFDNFSKQRIDPMEFYNNLGFGGQVAFTLGHALGAFVSAYTHTPDIALQIINSKIEQNIQAQRTNIALQGQSLEFMRQHHMDQNQYDALSRIHMLQLAQAKLGTITADGAGDLAQATAGQISDGIAYNIAAQKLSMQNQYDQLNAAGNGAGAAAKGAQPPLPNAQEQEKITKIDGANNALDDQFSLTSQGAQAYDAYGLPYEIVAAHVPWHTKTKDALNSSGLLEQRLIEALFPDSNRIPTDVQMKEMHGRAISPINTSETNLSNYKWWKTQLAAERILRYQAANAPIASWGAAHGVKVDNLVPPQPGWVKPGAQNGAAPGPRKIIKELPYPKAQ